MKEVIVHYAKCNRIINAQMNPLLATIPESYAHPLKGYFFKTVGGILDHIYTADMNWMKAFLANASHGLDLEREVGPIPQYGSPVFADFDAYLAGRQKLDDFYCRFAELLDEDDFARVVSRTSRAGDKMEKLEWKCLVHVFNHQTHHRGQLSHILDELGIENNYSNMIMID